jgi:competence CoiA-like predicted nuclease
MVFVNPLADIVKHFRHKVECPYSTEPESKEHLEMKAFFCRNFGGEPEFKIGNNITDVVIKHLNIAIECQVSPITLRTLQERTEHLNDYGYHVLWVFHKNNYWKETTVRNLSLLDALIIKPRKTEKTIHKLYYGRIYYYNCHGLLEAGHLSFEYGRGLGRSKRFGELHYINGISGRCNFVKVQNDGYKIVLLGDGVWWK